jgi:hypothetical protein
MSARYFGGLVRKDPLVLNPAAGNAANGVFTMSQYMQAVKAATWPAYDPYFNQTVLSLHGNGTNGDQNNTFLDSSTNNFTITRNGNTTQGTFSPFSVGAGEWSNYFDGTGDYLTWSGTTLSGDFTIECWVYKTAVDASGYTNVFSGPSNQQVAIDQTTAGSISLTINATTIISPAGTSVTPNAWHHLAWVREGSTCRAYVDGVQQGTGTSSASFSLNQISRYAITGGYEMNGYISNARIVAGTCLYPSGTTFTPPTAPLTAITNTSLLTCQSNRFVDNSTNAFTITRNGDVRVTPFSPFAPKSAYSPEVNGGSGYLDGTGDYLTVANNAAFDVAGGDFTIEGWFYQASAAAKQLFSKRADTTTLAPFYLSVDTAGNMNFLGSLGTGSWDVNMTASGANIARIASWNHIAITRSGNVYTFFVNGASAATTTVAGSLMTNTGALSIGAGSAAGTSPYNGYIFNFRFVKGVAVYTGAFTPPTLPLSTSGAASASAYPSTTNVNTSFASSACSLLCNFTNAGIFDNTGKNNLETLGNAQIDTAVKKFGDGSMEFDGSGDYLILPNNSEMTLGSGDFTVEGWLYLNSVSSTQFLIDQRPTSTQGVYPSLYMNSATLNWFVSTANRITSSNLSTSQWYHFAIVKSGSSTKMYIDGSQAGSTYTDTNNYLASRTLIGFSSFNDSPLNGYIDDLRITKGIARYTSNFTPQTSQWQDQ